MRLAPRPALPVDVDLEAVAGSVQAIVERVGPDVECWRTKADAYGHGAARVAHTALNNGAMARGGLRASHRAAPDRRAHPDVELRPPLAGRRCHARCRRRCDHPVLTGGRSRLPCGGGPGADGKGASVDTGIAPGPPGRRPALCARGGQLPARGGRIFTHMAAADDADPPTPCSSSSALRRCSRRSTGRTRPPRVTPQTTPPSCASPEPLLWWPGWPCTA